MQVLLKQLKSVYLSPNFDKVNFDPLYLLALASLVSKTTFAWDEINVERLPSKLRSLAAELRNLVCVNVCRLPLFWLATSLQALYLHWRSG